MLLYTVSGVKAIKGLTVPMGIHPQDTDPREKLSLDGLKLVAGITELWVVVSSGEP